MINDKGIDMKKFTVSLTLLLLFLALSAHPMKKREEIKNKKNVRRDQKVILISKDKKEFEISRKVAAISGYLKDQLEKQDEEKQGEIPRISMPEFYYGVV